MNYIQKLNIHNFWRGISARKTYSLGYAVRFGVRLWQAIRLLPCIAYDEDAEHTKQKEKLLNNRTTITTDILNTLTVQPNLPVFFKWASLAVFIFYWFDRRQTFYKSSQMFINQCENGLKSRFSAYLHFSCHISA